MSENKDLFINGLISLISEITESTPEIVKSMSEPDFTENHSLILKEKKLAKLPVTETAILTMRDALDKMPFFRDNPHSSKLFSFPVLPVMFSIIPLFTGKPAKSPRGLQKILNKPETERSESEKEMLKDTIYERLLVSEELEKTSQGLRKRKSFSMFICDSPIVQATAELDPGFNAEEETLSGYIGRVFGPEGMRHLLALLSGMEEHGRNGNLTLSINEHLQRMGYKREKSGSYNSRVKLVASDIIRLLSGLSITTVKQTETKIKISSQRLFTLVRSQMDFDFNKNILDGTFEIRAEDWWYKDAFNKTDSRPYCKLLKEIILEDHSQHSVTISLMPVLSAFWRQSPQPVFTAERLMDWCNLEHKTTSQGGDRHRIERLNKLEDELDYMKSKGYIGDWYSEILADKDPFSKNITINSPKWYENKIQEIENKSEPNLKSSTKKTLTRKEFLDIYFKSGLDNDTFSEKIGVSKRTVQYLVSGTKPVSAKLSDKIREVFSDILC